MKYRWSPWARIPAAGKVIDRIYKIYRIKSPYLNLLILLRKL